MPSHRSAEGAEPAGKEWVALAQAGSDRAFDELVAAYRYFLYRVALRKTGNAEDAEDVVQEVFVHVRRALPTYHDQNFDGWIRQILERCIIDWSRREAKRKGDRSLDETRWSLDGGDGLSLADSLPSGSDDGDRIAWRCAVEVHTRSTLDLLRRGLTVPRVSTRQFRFFEMRYFAHVPAEPEAIAALYGVSAKTVYRALGQACTAFCTEFVKNDRSLVAELVQVLQEGQETSLDPTLAAQILGAAGLLQQDVRMSRGRPRKPKTVEE